MSVTVSPSSPPQIPGTAEPVPSAWGRARVSFTSDDEGHTRLRGLRQDAPLRVLLPQPPAHEPAEAAFTNTGGGLVGGDCLEMAVTVGEGAAVLAYAQAAEKVYRTAQDPCRVEVQAKVEATGWLEWLPQETILFNQSQLHRRTVVDVDHGGTALCGEMLVFGRQAHGELYERGSAHELWEVRRQGRLTWAEAMRLDGSARTALDHPAGFGGARICATMVCVLPDPDDSAVEQLREIPQPEGLLRAFTLVNGIIVGRWLAPHGDENSTEALRNDYGRVWSHARQQFGGWKDRLPRLWSM